MLDICITNRSWLIDQHHLRLWWLLALCDQRILTFHRHRLSVFLGCSFEPLLTLLELFRTQSLLVALLLSGRPRLTCKHLSIR